MPDGSKETYSFLFPKMVVGNLMLGTRYIEAQGSGTIFNERNGFTCNFEFHPRAWTSNYYTNRVDMMVKDDDDVGMVKIEGYHTSTIEATDLATGKTKCVFTAPPYRDDADVNFNMNVVALQLN